MFIYIYTGMNFQPFLKENLGICETCVNTLKNFKNYWRVRILNDINIKLQFTEEWFEKQF